MSNSTPFWDRLSKGYDEKAKDKTYEQILLRSKKYMRQDALMLDFACATGLYAFAFANAIKEIHAFDTSAKMIAVAKKLARETGSENISFSHTDLFNENYKEGSYDIILALNILLYFEDATEVLKRMHRLLKKDGILITSTACLKEKRTFIGKVSGLVLALLKGLRVLPYIKFLKIKELEETIKTNGFATIESEVLIEKPALEYFIVAKKS